MSTLLPEQPSLTGKHSVPETRFMASSGNASLVSQPGIAVRNVKHMIGNMEAINHFARDFKLGASVSIANDTFMLQLTSKSVQGQIPDISKGDFEFMGAVIEAERLRMKDAIPEMFRTVNTKLVVLSLDFRVCPPTMALLPPENFYFCEYHDNRVLREKWEQLRRGMDTLVHPTLMICAHVQRGETSAALCRLITMTLNEKSEELVVYKGVGCSC